MPTGCVDPAADPVAASAASPCGSPSVPRLDDGGAAPSIDVDPLDPTVRRLRADARLGPAVGGTSGGAGGGVVVGTLVGRFPTPALFVADRIDGTPPDLAPAVRRAFARAAAAAVAPRNGEVLVTEPGSPEGWREAVEACGLVVRAANACVRRALDATLPTVTRSFVLRSLTEVGEDVFRARLGRASSGDPFDTRAGHDPRDAWRDLVASAGDRFDPTSWFLVDDADGPVGVVLPQTVGADLGTLYYLGVEPPRRGQGLGTAVHALGLWILAMRGLRRYVGSTDERNAPMLRVFARNGCPVTERNLHFAAPPAPPPR